MSKRTKFLLGIGVIAALILGLQVAAFASHPGASLPGSNFEIDTNANLKVDDAAPSIDWASVTEARQTDAATGPGDDSYSVGRRRTTPVRAWSTAASRTTRATCKTFGAYVEPEAGGPGYLNLFWTRVQEPSGTTLMDFELNQSSTICANGVNPVRTAGDLLIEYRIEQGGARCCVRSTARHVDRELDACWGPATNLTGCQ